MPQWLVEFLFQNRDAIWLAVMGLLGAVVNLLTEIGNQKKLPKTIMAANMITGSSLSGLANSPWVQAFGMGQLPTSTAAFLIGYMGNRILTIVSKARLKLPQQDTKS